MAATRKLWKYLLWDLLPGGIAVSVFAEYKFPLLSAYVFSETVI
jgi:hypothetical protein